MAAQHSWARVASAVCRRMPLQLRVWTGPSRRHPCRSWERLFDRPAAPGDRDDVGHGGGPARRRPAQVEGVLVWAADQPADEQVLAVDAGRPGRQRQRRHAVQQRGCAITSPKIALTCVSALKA